MNTEEDEFRRIEAEAKRRAAQQALPDSGKRGSIALARSLCYQINGAADDSDDIDGGGYGSVDIAEILSAEVVRLQKALAQPVFDCPRCGHVCSQRPWQGLTEEEVRFYTEKHRALVNAHYDKVADTNIITEAFDSTAFYKDVSAVLKDRNT